jgi:hypothetical protein
MNLDLSRCRHPPPPALAVYATHAVVFAVTAGQNHLAIGSPNASSPGYPEGPPAITAAIPTVFGLPLLL